MNYSTISNLGSNLQSEVDNPLTYCMNNNMDQRFLHGGNADVYGQHSRPCQLFMSEYCATKWDSFCEAASYNTNTSFPNNAGSCLGNTDVSCKDLTAGEVLIKNTAARKYLVKMVDMKKTYEPFDPNVANSPLISYWIPTNGCSDQSTGIPIYSVNSKTIDSDHVMNKILSKPIIAFDILVNIYNTMKRTGKLKDLRGTKIGNFFITNPYFKSKGGI